MNGGLFWALATAAVSIGALHSLAPDHWLPFAALGRARGWSPDRTAALTLVCGLGHVTVSVALGSLGLFLGVEMLEAFGRRMEATAGLLLIGFGLAYGLLGLRRAVGRRLHAHRHSLAPDHPPRERTGEEASQGGNQATASRRTAWTLFLLFSADPCVAVVPLMFAAAPLGPAGTAAVVALYEVATLATMVALVLPARAGAGALQAAWIDRFGDALAGAVISAAGLAVVFLGI